MPLAPNGWEAAHADGQLDQCIPLFLETDASHYRKMNREYCRDKIDYDCMYLWRRTNIDWTNAGTVLRQGIALAFQLWRPRYSNETAIEDRWCLCLFLGNQQTNPSAFVGDLKNAVKAFAPGAGERDRVFIVKDTVHTYPARIEAVFNYQDIASRLSGRNRAPQEYGWRERHVWKIVDWS
jgi:hypothetical protein